MDSKDLENRFAFHAASRQSRGSDHQGVRTACLTLAQYLSNLLPDGREQSLAITKLEEVMFWANAAIARSVPLDQS